MIDLMLGSQAVLFAAGVVLVGVAVNTYRTESKSSGRFFSLLVSLLGATAFCLSITAGTGTLNKVIWLVTNLSIPIALLAFAVNYYGLTLFGSRLRTAAVLTPTVLGLVGSLLVILGTPQKTPGVEAPLQAVTALPAAVFGIATTFDRIGYYYTAGVVVFAVGVVALNIFRYEHLDTRLAGLVAFIGAWPWLGNFLVPELSSLFGDGVSISVLAVGYATSAGVTGLVVGPLGLLGSSPAAGNVGPERVLDSMDDAVIITDDYDRVLRLNRVACERFGTTETVAVGQSLSESLGVSPEELSGTETAAIETVEGIRQFAVTRSPVTDDHEFERGTVFVLRDVTQRQTRQQRLEVLNRVLRHNLRNNANSIIARAEIINSDHQTEDTAEEIIETTQSLVGVAETARDIETMMEAPEPASPTALKNVLKYVLSEIKSEYPAVDITTALPKNASATVSPETLETVLYNIVENAAEHNDSEEPLIVVSAEKTDSELTIAVSDNGPGIPEHERIVVEEGEENPLQHGSGLGLWAIHWGITQMGGTFSISDNEPRGSTVTISLPSTITESATEPEHDGARVQTTA